MSLFGKDSTTTMPTLSPEQNAMIKAQTAFSTNVVQPTYENYIKGATDLYNQSAGGINNAAQNMAGTAAQAQNVLGSTGESALRTGIMGLQNLYSPDYEANQLQAAMAPAQAQYMQNIAGQNAGFGGAGQLGSARQALAGQQLAGQTAALQAKTAADIQNQIAQQRMAAGQSLIGAGQAGMTGAQNAAQNIIAASQIPMSAYTTVGQQYGLVNPSTYSPSFAGTQGSSGTKTSFGI